MKRNENKKSLKKKVLVVSGLALLLGLIGYTGGNTYAKYIDQVSAPSQTATVAKWGHVVNIQDADLFGSDYTLSTGTSATEVEDNTGVAVSAKTSAGNIVAPGTTGSIAFSIKGTAEVYSQLTVDVTGKDVGLSDGTNKEFPVKWTLSKDGTPVVQNKTLQEVVTHLDGFDEKIDIGEESSHAGEYLLTWSWSFETAGESTLTDHNDYGTTDKLSNNGVDTIMGWLADGTNPTDVANYSLVDASGAANNTWEFYLKIVVEQIQA